MVSGVASLFFLSFPLFSFFHSFFFKKYTLSVGALAQGWNAYQACRNLGSITALLIHTPSLKQALGFCHRHSLSVFLPV